MSQRMKDQKLCLKLQKDTSVHGEEMKMREGIINLYEFAALNKTCLQCKQFCDITADGFAMTTDGLAMTNKIDKLTMLKKSQK